MRFQCSRALGRVRYAFVKPSLAPSFSSCDGRAIGEWQRYFTYGNFVSVNVFRKETIAASSYVVRPRLPNSLVMLAAYSGAGQPAPGTSRVL